MIGVSVIEKELEEIKKAMVSNKNKNLLPVFLRETGNKCIILLLGDKWSRYSDLINRHDFFVTSYTSIRPNDIKFYDGTTTKIINNNQIQTNMMQSESMYLPLYEFNKTWTAYEVL